MKNVPLMLSVLLAACRPSASSSPDGDPAESPVVESPERMDPVDTPSPQGPRLKTVLASGCAIVGPRAIVCASDDHAAEGAARWQPLVEHWDPEEHYVHIDADRERLCALVQPSGRISCWSRAPSGGPPDKGRFPPADLEPIRAAIDMALLDHATCALVEGGEVSCWGDNRSAQLGDGTRAARGEPQTVDLPAPVVDIEGYYTTVCALLETGAVHCWGANDTAGDRHRIRPEPIEGLPPVLTLESTRWARVNSSSWARWKTVDHVPYRGFSTAELVPTAERFKNDPCWHLDGALWCKGSDDTVATKLLDEVAELDLESSRHGCLRRSDRSVWCLGAKLPLFSPSPEVEAKLPTRVPGLADVTDVVATSQGACALHDGGAVSCWGSGQHVPHDERQKPYFIGTPQRVPLPGPAQQVTATRGSACALVGGAAHCWGREGTVRDLGPAVALTTVAGFACADTGTALSCLHSTHSTYELPRVLPRPRERGVTGHGRSCRVRRGRVVCAWDDETIDCPPANNAPDACELSIGTAPRPSKSDRSLRARPDDAILVGGGGTCVLSGSGVLRCSSAVDHWLTYPGIDFDAEREIVAADAGVYSVCAIARDGALRCWLASRYSNESGVRVDLGIEDAVAVSLGERNGYVIRTDGTLWSWGPNTMGERGLGGWAWRRSKIPVPVEALGEGAVMPEAPERRW